MNLQLVAPGPPRRQHHHRAGTWLSGLSDHHDRRCGIGHGGTTGSMPNLMRMAWLVGLLRWDMAQAQHSSMTPGPFGNMRSMSSFGQGEWPQPGFGTRRCCIPSLLHTEHDYGVSDWQDQTPPSCPSPGGPRRCHPSVGCWRRRRSRPARRRCTGSRPDQDRTGRGRTPHPPGSGPPPCRRRDRTP